jgi:hypothetical protein
MNYHPRQLKLTRLSAQLEELFVKVSDCGTLESLPQDLADEIAATAGEVMVELSDQRGDGLVRDVVEDARRLREVVRTLHPERARVSAAGRALAHDLEVVIRQGRRAA